MVEGIEGKGKLTITAFFSSPNLVEQHFNYENNVVQIIIEGGEQKKQYSLMPCFLLILNQGQQGSAAGSDSLNSVG